MLELPQKLSQLEVASLQHDKNNPRLPASVDPDDDAAILDYMLREANLLELMGSISERGYFLGEPLLVVQAEGGKYDVIEGNRRLSAVRLLLKPALAPSRKVAVTAVAEQAKFKPTKLPALIFKSREEVLPYLGFRHITGTKSWDSLQKAKFLDQLSASPHYGALPEEKMYQSLAKEIGSKSDYVARLLASYSVYKTIQDRDFFDIPNLKEDDIPFSILHTALASYSDIADYIGMESSRDRKLNGIKTEHLKNLAVWLFQANTEGRTVLGESRNLKYLAAVVKSESALSKLEDGEPLKTAYMYSSGPSEAFREYVRSSRRSLEEARNSVHITELNSSDIELCRDVRALAHNLYITVSTSLEATG